MGKITICRAPDGGHVALDEEQAVIAQHDIGGILQDSVWSNKLYEERYPEGYTIDDWTTKETDHD